MSGCGLRTLNVGIRVGDGEGEGEGVGEGLGLGERIGLGDGVGPGVGLLCAGGITVDWEEVTPAPPGRLLA